jgi:uncharacterized protein YutD
MTLQNLSKILDKYDKQNLGGTNTQEQLRLLGGLPFYNFQNHDDLNTFNHALNTFRSKFLNLIIGTERRAAMDADSVASKS